jgi:electron-transferring-flavoprotein dehydrogenase
MTREVMDFDVVIVGAGPAGLAASIRLAQLAGESPLNICVIDKAEEIGGQILSGAVLEPRALNELLPDWQSLNPPLHTPVTDDHFLLMTQSKSWRLPTPPQMHNHGNYIISLGQFCRWLAAQAENLGVNVFPGFSAAEIIYENNSVVGIITGDKGLDKNGQPKSNFQPGMELRAKQVMFAEGCRGSLTQTLFPRYQLRKDVDPQTYGLGIKELWEIPASQHQKGKVVHTIGWPLDTKTYGGSFIYHLGENLLAIGMVIGLDYQNPYLNPYEEFQRFKSHPSIRPLLENGKRLEYGARTLIEGGLQSIPKLTFPGGLIIGDAAGFLNVAKIKGIHNAMKSGMVAAECLYPCLTSAATTIECTAYPEQLKASWLWEDLYRVRNIRPAFRWGLWPALAYSAIDTYLFRGRAPWTLHHHKPDHDTLKKASACQKIDYPKHDNIVSFDLMTSVFLTHSTYDEDQPYHLKLKNLAVEIDINLKEYAAPEQRYCPAGVYEILQNEEQKPYLQINAANCVHCKACDIKDPTQNIVWTTPEGGSGPQYNMM